MPSIVGKLNLYSYSPNICRRNNGTNICDAGYKLGTIGICFSQSLGKLNSTGFEPEFPVCLVDYESLLDSTYILHKSSGTISSSSVQDKDDAFGNIDGEFTIHSVSQVLSAVTSQIQIQNGVLDNTVSIYAISMFLSNFGYILKSYESTFSDYNIHHAGKNVIPHIKNRQSQYWVVDTFSSVDIVKKEISRDKLAPIFAAEKKMGSTIISSNTLGVDTPYILGENPVDICADDLTKPTITGTTPGTSSHLNIQDTYVEFSVFDSVAGVDLGVLKVTVSGNNTVQPEGYLVVSSGVDQTGGNVNITGSPELYTVRYTPSLSWEKNEVVSVTVSGQDLEPQSGNQDWFCSSPGTRNIFGYEYSFQVLDDSFMGASITCVPDTSPPYLDNISPGMYTRENSVSSSLDFDIIDDAAGVNLASLNIWVDGVLIVENGDISISGVTLQILQNGFRVHYTPQSSFSYNSNIEVRVLAYDNNTNPAPNLADITYFFTTIGNSTFIVENFTPEPFTSYLAETKDICVDIYDTSFGIKDAHFVINGTVFSGSTSNIFGATNITTTYSGIDTIFDATYSGTNILDSYVSNAVIDGLSLLSGTISFGNAYSGYVYDLPAPYNNFTTRDLVSGTIIEGTLTSGTLVDTLVSGVNWNGSYSNASIYGVDLSNSLFTGDTTGTTISGIVGYTMCYHPENDFYYEGTIEVFVHAINNNSISPAEKNELYKLYHGFRVLKHRYEAAPSSNVSIFARAINNELLLNTLSSIYQVTTYKQPEKDLSVKITAIRPWEDLLSSIQIISPTHEYGKTITVEFYIEDNDGHPFGPYIFTYTIEDAP